MNQRRSTPVRPRCYEWSATMALFISVGHVRMFVPEFKKAVAKVGSTSAMRVERGGDGKWVSWTWKQYYGGCFWPQVYRGLTSPHSILCADDSVQFARALLSIGFQVRDLPCRHCVPRPQTHVCPALVSAIRRREHHRLQHPRVVHRHDGRGCCWR